MYPTRHAVRRYQERVELVSTAAAFRRLEVLAASSRIRSTPRWWTPARPAPGLSFAYPASLPGVCLLVRDGAILTVFERSQCQEWASAQTDVDPGGSVSRRRAAYRRPSTGTRWEFAA